uniref:putative gustatory receptor 28b n=1 Tax=Vespula vulgaris TaxID=7454 RepID=UPI00223B5385|nr:putative gustatory receptor 28b [Vespula vulgaris]
MITDFTIIFWIRYVKILFGQLNAVLQNMLTTTIDSPQHKRVLRMKDNWEDDSLLSTIYRTYKANENLKKLKRVKQIHLELIKCAGIINEAYGLQILMSMSSSVFIIIIHDVMYQLVQNRLKFTACVLILCHISLHATNTGDILCELYEPSTSNEFRAEIRDFTLQLIQNPLSFTICGFFDLDYTLIRNVIATVITYLVILIQMGNIPSEFIVENSTLITNDSRKI